jgi:hypothetical protein
MTSLKKQLQPTLPRNLEMHPRGLPYFPNVASTVAEAVCAVDSVDTVNVVETVEAVEVEIAMRVSAPSAKLTAILQMHAESGNALRREEATMSAFTSSARSQVTSKSIVSPTNV